MPLDDLFEEAERQLSVCNSCRYCAGYCPVWPALELRTTLGRREVLHLANLCHDCRDCFTACMYAPPHEFGINPPRVFSAAREVTYQEYLWRPPLPGWLRGRWSLAAGLALAALFLLALGLLTGAGQGWGTATSGSPYAVIGHWTLVVVFTTPFLYAGLVLLAGAARYWRDTHGSLADLRHLSGWMSSLRKVALLKHQTGGGEDCSYQENEPSRARRIMHQAVMYGFLLAMISTASAAVMENVLGLHPPYGYLSVPVVTGTAGGVAMIVGCAGLIVLKRRSDPSQVTGNMLRADYSFIMALLVLTVTGMLTLVLRTTAAFAPMLLLHLAATLVAFVIAPYTKFVHWVFRLLAIYKDGLETKGAARAGQ